MMAVAPALATASTPSGKGKKASEAATRPGERQHGLHGADLRGVHAAHLAGADADALAVAGVEDGVGLDVLADLPGEEQGAHLLGGGLPLGDHLEVGVGEGADVVVLHEDAAGDIL